MKNHVSDNTLFVSVNEFRNGTMKAHEKKCDMKIVFVLLMIKKKKCLPILFQDIGLAKEILLMSKYNRFVNV